MTETTNEKPETAKKKKAPKMPKGVRMPHNKMKIAVVIDKAVFDDVVRNGVKRDLNFSDSLNDVAKCGILCLKESGDLD